MCIWKTKIWIGKSIQPWDLENGLQAIDKMTMLLSEGQNCGS